MRDDSITPSEEAALVDERSAVALKDTTLSDEVPLHQAKTPLPRPPRNQIYGPINGMIPKGARQHTRKTTPRGGKRRQR